MVRHIFRSRDFSYEVSRSLYACEGSILIVDSTQGVEAQTLANVYQALDINHEIVPVLNKVDLPASDLDRTKTQIEEVIGIDTEGAIPCSGKTGEGIENILEQIIKVFDVYEGENIPENQKSIAISVTIQSSEKTLNDNDLESINNSIIKTVENKTGAKIRS